MPLAQSLRDLLRIRQHHARELRGIPGCLGTAVGFKYSEKLADFEVVNGRRKPAILVFVQEKIPDAALPEPERIKKTYRGPGGLTCFSDVIVGRPPELIAAATPTTGRNGQLIQELHTKDLGIIGGIPIEGAYYQGTGGVVLSARGRLGLLTNFHVAGFEGSRLLRLGPRVEPLGTTQRSRPIAKKHTRNPNDLESFTDADHRIDVGFVELDQPEKARPGVHGLMQPLGRPFQLDLSKRGLDPIGRAVVGVGQKLGRQQGRIIAYGYEWRATATSAQWYATDYLIQSLAPCTPFAAPGDSGKLVVTDDDQRQPIALLWGGERHFFDAASAQATLAYATDLGLVLKILDNAKINWKPADCVA